MTILARIAGGIVGLVSVIGVAVWLASENGEIVVLTTRDAENAPQQTRLWVVDHDGHAWLRAGADVQGWYVRLLAKPQVEVERDGTTASYTAVPVPEKRGEINALMLDKYGWADQWVGFLFSRDDSVPIRLDPPAGGAS